MGMDDNKLSNFERLVLNEAEKQRDTILQETKRERDARIAVIEKQLTDVADREIARELAKIERNKNEHMIKKQIAQKQTLLNEREHLIDSIFLKVREDLKAYTKTEAYALRLEQIVQRAMEQFGPDSAKGLTVLLSEQDRDYQARLETLGVQVELTEANIVGGCKIICKDRGVQVDETFATKLEERRAGFLETFNLKL